MYILKYKALNQLLRENKKSKINNSSSITKKNVKPTKEVKSNDVPTTTAKTIKKRKSINGTAASLRKFKKNQIRTNIEHKEKERYIEEVSINPLRMFLMLFLKFNYF